MVVVTEWSVRPATVADAMGIARVHITSWRETYAHLLPADALAALDAERFATRWGTTIAGDDSGVWVAERDGAIVGWASTSAEHTADPPRELQLGGLYVLAAEHGSGIGAALLDAALGGAPAYLWVASDNPRAHAFYRKHGFVADGARDSHPLLGVDVDITRYTR